MKTFKIVLTEQELEFARQLINSDLPIAIKGAEIVVGFKTAINTAQLIVPESNEHNAND